MDALDLVAAAADDLLERVDRLLGAPGDHPLWTLLRGVRALPGDTVAAIVALRPEELTGAASTLRGLVPAYDGARDALGRPTAWDGAAGEAYAVHAGTLSDGVASAAAHVLVTSSSADAVAAWLTDARSRLAMELAAVLTSAEAVSVVLGAPDAQRAAATIAVRVLSVVDDVIAAGAVLVPG
jgi:hypothetical protein